MIFSLTVVLSVLLALYGQVQGASVAPSLKNVVKGGVHHGGLHRDPEVRLVDGIRGAVGGDGAIHHGLGVHIASPSSRKAFSDFIVPPAGLQSSPYARWAHQPWIWFHNSHSNTADITELVEGYKANNIPFGAVNIDSTWETAYNNFEVDKNKFPDFPSFIKSLKDQGLYVTMWITSMIDTDNPDYQFAVDNSYLVKDKFGVVRPLKWWHGSGGLLDYTNPKAVDWWHSLMDKVLDVGIDGFKTDGTDPYIAEYIAAGGAQGYDGKPITYQDYAKYYYSDFLKYPGSKKNGNTLIMARPVDCMIDKPSKMCWGYAPRDTMFSGWVGDDDSTFQGMRGCMRKVIYSAWRNFANMGCDIGGYREEVANNTYNKEYFIRSAQMGAFLPLMENGGGGEHRPWMYDQETVDIYRKFAEEHVKLAPYLHTTGTYAIENGVSSIVPVAQLDPAVADANAKLGFDFSGQLPYFEQPSTYSYQLGKDILVHPVMYNDDNRTSTAGFVDMKFPGDSSTTWLDYWQPWMAAMSVQGGVNRRRMVALDDMAVYVRQNALIATAPAPDLQSKFKYQFVWYAPKSSDVAVADARERCADDVASCGVRVSASYASPMVVEVSAFGSGAPDGVQVDIVHVPEPASMNFYPSKLVSGCSWGYELKTSTVHISCTNPSQGVKVEVVY